MTPENFCYFLQGYLETSNPDLIDSTQTLLIKKKLEETVNPVYIAAQSIEPLKPFCGIETHPDKSKKLYC